MKIIDKGKTIPSDNNLKAKTAMFTIFLILATALAMSCRECPTEPENHNNNQTDTTSHNFIWEIDTLGTKDISLIRDIVAISPNDVWAVGSISIYNPFEQDSTGWWINKYNAAHWDGEKWTLKCIPFKSYQSFIYAHDEICSVLAFDSNDVWFTNGGSLTRWNGTKYEYMAAIFQGWPDSDFGLIRSMWGTADDNIYGVGENGFCFHYTGSGQWEALETNTRISLRKLIGNVNSKSGAIQLWAGGYDDGYGWLLQNKDNEWNMVWNQGDSLYEQPYEKYMYPTTAIWTPDYKNIFIGVNKGYKDATLMKHSLKDFSDYDPLGQLEWGFPLAINGNADNDFFVVGYSLSVIHYNGSTVKYYPEAAYDYNGVYWCVSQVGDYVFMGRGISFAAVVRGRRYQ
ncbi:MAG: hypothetical protein PHW79_09815 [Candidatus Marinimicrobia bacterium]|nr:hypothetical protein [Candidatus Neomarinimicrobiota bacterium]